MENTDQVSLYNNEDRNILRIAEDSLDSRLDLVQDIRAFHATLQVRQNILKIKVLN